MAFNGLKNHLIDRFLFSEIQLPNHNIFIFGEEQVFIERLFNTEFLLNLLKWNSFCFGHHEKDP
jgi:hypothetical protein